MSVSSKVSPDLRGRSLNYQWWMAGGPENRNKWTCIACHDHTWRTLHHAMRHEDTHDHKKAIAYRISHPARPMNDRPSSRSQDAVSAALQGLLGDLSEAISESASAPVPFSNGVEDAMVLDWDNIAAEMSGDLTPSMAQQAVSRLAATLEDWLADSDSSSIDSQSEPEERLEEGTVEDDDKLLATGASRMPQRHPVENPDWYPWPDKETCVLDIVRHLPRSLFSDNQMQIIIWCLHILGVDNIPSIPVLKAVDELLQRHCGVDTIRYNGPLGHIYYVNDL